MQYETGASGENLSGVDGTGLVMRKTQGEDERMRRQNKMNFDRIMGELLLEDSGTRMLDACMDVRLDTADKIPLRYRLIALGFVKQYSLDELNERLQKEGFARLYSRNIWEAGLIYAFSQRMPWEKWKRLQSAFDEAVSAVRADGRELTEGQITLEDLDKYVKEHSEISDGVQLTGKQTEKMEKHLREIEEDEEFLRFLRNNMESFSAAREKTRYYFCKYLSFYLNGKIRHAREELGRGKDMQEVIQELRIFRCTKRLYRLKKSAYGEIEDILRHAALSPGSIFNEFSYFYFGYVSASWMEVLLESYDYVERMTEQEKHSLAESLRRNNRMLRQFSDEEVLRREMERIERQEEEKDFQYARNQEDNGYKRNRSEENTIRKFLKGTLDIDRTTLLCFLLFFGAVTELPADYAVTGERLNDILLQCGFPGLRECDGFDSFVLHYLSSGNPQDYLIEEVTRYARMEKDFYLYHVFQGAYSYEETWRNLFQIP